MLIALLETLEGDEEKRLFTRIFNENHIKMERYAIHMLWEQHDAEDAVQNAFIQVIRHFEKIYKIPCEELPFWLISIVKNESLKILRKRNEMVDFEHIDDYVSQTDHELAYHELVAQGPAAAADCFGRLSKRRGCIRDRSGTGPADEADFARCSKIGYGRA